MLASKVAKSGKQILSFSLAFAFQQD